MTKFIAVLLLASAVGVAEPASGAGVAVILSDRVDDYEEALRGFKEVKPDLILAIGVWALTGASLNVPVEQSLRLLKQLGPPIIAITSFALSGDEQRAKDAGASAYLAEPFSPFGLLTMIRKLVPEE